jgi:mono/diheme cytochrome c family protein
VSALWCLEGLGSLALDDAKRALADPDAHVRIAALQAAEPLLISEAGAPLIAGLVARIGTEEPIVLAHAALALGPSRLPAARDFLWRTLPRAAEHSSLTDALQLALRGQEVEILRRVRTDVATHGAANFGAAPLLESLALHLALAGGAAVDPLTAAIADPELPQHLRLALMRGATKAGGASLPEKALAQLAARAPDAQVRQKAEAAVAAIRQRRARQAARPAVAPLTHEQRALFEAGKVTYAICAACHQPDGLGKVALAPTLKEGRWANAVSPDAAIRIVLKGKEGTPGFPAPMAPLEGLSDEQLAGALTFVRRSFGNNASAVHPAEFTRVRRELATRVSAFTDAELEKLFPDAK